jgi:predicted NBD/HSP70 family sugar kinase
MPSDVIVFDIGGTWFRSGIFTAKDSLEKLTRRPAINYKNTPYRSITQLQQLLVDYLVENTTRLRTESPNAKIEIASVSLGAAISAHTGFVLNSGPLWGPDCLPVDLLSALREREPGVQWAIVNDITAALMRHVPDPEFKDLSKLTLLTVSTGIGCRTYDARLQVVPVDRVHGLQGEIGHLPVVFTFDGHLIELYCDCGEANHLNAFCSGRGIEALILRLGTLCMKEIRSSILSVKSIGESDGEIFQLFVQALNSNDPFAVRVLDAVTKPIANILLVAFTLDPEVEAIIMTGGVIDSVGERYINSLRKHLDNFGMYQITSRDPEFFSRRIRMKAADDKSGLIGAGLYARALLRT